MEEKRGYASGRFALTVFAVLLMGLFSASFCGCRHVPSASVPEAPPCPLTPEINEPPNLYAYTLDASSNHPPVAVASGDQFCHVGDTVYLDGTKSYDPEGNPLTCRWLVKSRPEGSSAKIVNSRSFHAAFTPDRDGTFRIQIRVQDNCGFIGADEILISTANLPAFAGIDMNR